MLARWTTRPSHGTAVAGFRTTADVLRNKIRFSVHDLIETKNRSVDFLGLPEASQNLNGMRYPTFTLLIEGFIIFKSKNKSDQLTQRDRFYLNMGLTQNFSRDQ